MAVHLYIATFLFNTHIFNSYTACRYHISAVVIAADIKFNTNTALCVLVCGIIHLRQAFLMDATLTQAIVFMFSRKLFLYLSS